MVTKLHQCFQRTNALLFVLSAAHAAGGGRARKLLTAVQVCSKCLAYLVLLQRTGTDT